MNLVRIATTGRGGNVEVLLLRIGVLLSGKESDDLSDLFVLLFFFLFLLFLLFPLFETFVFLGCRFLLFVVLVSGYHLHLLRLHHFFLLLLYALLSVIIFLRCVDGRQNNGILLMKVPIEDRPRSLPL